MALGSDILLKIRSTFEPKAIDEAIKKTKDLGTEAAKSAETTSTKSVSAFTKIGDAVRSVSSKMEIVNKLMSGLGIVGVLSSIIAVATRIKQKFDEIAEAARKVKLDKISSENETAVKSLTSQWGDLLKTIDQTNQSILRNREIEAARTKNKRDMEDISADMDQQDALDKLDRSDPLYNQKAAEIRARFKSQATDRQSARETEDINLTASQEGEKIKDLRNKEIEARSFAEKSWSEYSKQQSQISELQSPVIKTRDVYRSAGAFAAVKVGTERYEDEAATKQNREAAEKMKDNLPALEKIAREAVSKAEDITNQIVFSAQKASTIFEASKVSTQKGRLSARLATGERSEAYRATGLAESEIEKNAIRRGLEEKLSINNEQQAAAEERFKPLLESATRRRDIRVREASQSKAVVEQYRQKGGGKGLVEAERVAQQVEVSANEAQQELIRIGQQMLNTMESFKKNSEVLREQMKRVGS
jgi:hypothetical protein